MLGVGGLARLSPRLPARAWAGRRWPARRPACTRALLDATARLLDRQWLLKDPSTQLSWVREGGSCFVVVRDDLTHPFLGGNKFRKLDGLWPQLQQATDVVTCGGVQSAHTTAVAAACASHGIRAHLLVRGERPAVPTGHHLYSRMLAHTIHYVSRAEYADRKAMLDGYVQQLEAAASVAGERLRVAGIPEGAAQPEALLGTVRLVAWLATQSELAGRACHMLVDSGTGATATGLALGAALLGLPWRVSGVMLAGTLEYYTQQQDSLLNAFAQQFLVAETGGNEVLGRAAAALEWVPRAAPRKFGRVLPGEIERCKRVAQAHGIVVDPIWSLAAWEAAAALAACQAQAGQGDARAGEEQRTVVMVHTGGMLGLCGLAQRVPDDF